MAIPRPKSKPEPVIKRLVACYKPNVQNRYPILDMREGECFEIVPDAHQSAGQVAGYIRRCILHRQKFFQSRNSHREFVVRVVKNEAGVKVARCIRTV